MAALLAFSAVSCHLLMRIVNDHLFSVRGALMNSDERKAARRKRREQARQAKKKERLKDCTLENVADIDNLYIAALQSKRGVSWKASVQRYHMNILKNIVKSHDELLAGEDIRRGFNKFKIHERGKLRDICSVHISERVIQKSLTQNALVPAFVPSFIRNNTANVKGRGVHDALARLKKDLVRHYRKHGEDGYILMIDFTSYFANIAHEPLKQIVEETLDDRRVVKLVHDLIDSCGEVGLGLGSEPNQILAVAFPSKIDHYVTEMLGISKYGRYMDDSYFIHESKEYLQVVLGLVKIKCEELGITISENKTRIVKLSHGFTWLKKKISYGENGKVIMRPCRDSITRHRRKLKKMRGLVDAGVMTVEQAARSHQSWRGSMLKIHAHRSVLEMDALFKKLFNEEPPPLGKNRI